MSSLTSAADPEQTVIVDAQATVADERRLERQLSRRSRDTRGMAVRLQLCRRADLGERLARRAPAPGAAEHGCCREEAEGDCRQGDDLVQGRKVGAEPDDRRPADERCNDHAHRAGQDGKQDALRPLACKV